MGLIFKVIFGFILGIGSGYGIDLLSKKFVSETQDRINDYNLNKKIVITATVIFTVAIFIKLNWIGFLHYGVIGLALILIGIIDHYTHYVYLIISIPTVILGVILGIYFNGIYSLIIQVPLFLLLFIIAYFTNKFYGDIEAMIIIGSVTGMLGLLIVTIIALFLTIPELVKNRKDKNYSVAFCTYLSVGYLVSLIII